jgi:hypothetical protein
MLAADAQDRIAALVEVMEPFVSRHPLQPYPIPLRPKPIPPSSPLINKFLLVDRPYKVPLHKETGRIDLLGLVSLVPCPGAWPLFVHSSAESPPISLAHFPSELATWPRLAVPAGPPPNQRRKMGDG